MTDGHWGWHGDARMKQPRRGGTPLARSPLLQGPPSQVPWPPPARTRLLPLSHTDVHTTHTSTHSQSSHYLLCLGRKQLSAAKLLLVFLWLYLPGCWKGRRAEGQRRTWRGRGTGRGEELVNNAIRGVVAQQQSGAGCVRAPGQGSGQWPFLGCWRNEGPPCPATPKGSSCVKGLASYITGDKGRWAISTPCLSKSIPPGGDHVLPMWTPWVSAWLPAICRSPSSGTPFVPFPGKWNRGSREALSVPLQLCSQPPRPREVQAAALCRAQRDGASPPPP